MEIEKTSFNASVKNHSAYNPESCPLAFSLKVAPKASASFGTHQEDVIFPLPSAIAVNGWWYCGSVPRESPTVCTTCSVTVSPG